MTTIAKYLVQYDPSEISTKCFSENCDFEATQIAALFSHYRLHHKNDNKFFSKCLYSRKCFHTKPFLSFSGLNMHIRRYHKDFFSKLSPSSHPKNADVSYMDGIAFNTHAEVVADHEAQFNNAVPLGV